MADKLKNLLEMRDQKDRAIQQYESKRTITENQTKLLELKRHNYDVQIERNKNRVKEIGAKLTELGKERDELTSQICNFQ